MSSSEQDDEGLFPGIKRADGTDNNGLSKRKQKKIEWSIATDNIKFNQAKNNLERPQNIHVDFLRRARQLNLNLIHFSHNPNYDQIKNWQPPLTFQVVPDSTIYPDSSGVPDPTWIKNPNELTDLVKKLETCSEFALDTEAHTTDTKQGFIALIQISTWEFGDFLVDATKLHKEIQGGLKRIIEDTCIIKILHGGENDILWLQQCYSIFIGGIMDTQILYGCVNGVMRSVGFSNMAKAFFPKHKDLLDVKETFSDWRLRPGTGFTDNQKVYATNDTHFLLRVYNEMKKILEARGPEGASLLSEGFELSKRSCLNKLFKNRIGSQPTPMEITTRLVRFLIQKDPDIQFSKSQLALMDMMMEWRQNLGNVLDQKDNDVLSERTIIRVVRSNPSSYYQLERVLRYEGNLSGTLQKQLPVLLELVTKRNIEKLRDVECLRCLKKGHGPAVFCPSEKIPGKLKEYLHREGNGSKLTAMNKRRRDRKTPEQRRRQRQNKKANRKIKEDVRA